MELVDVNEKTVLTKSANDNEAKESRCPRVLLAFIGLYGFILVVFLVVALLLRKHTSHPHVLFIIADDLGWNDVGWRAPDMRTPGLDAMATKGILLNWSYVHPLDSPTRAAFLTGMYPYHMGLQHEQMKADTPTYVPDRFLFLPQYLKQLGYHNHFVGKWHLGFCDFRYTPTRRGFDSFAGFYTDNLDHYSHKDVNSYYDFRYAIAGYDF